jgi:hypothetical protein
MKAWEGGDVIPAILNLALTFTPVKKALDSH